jgi:hypothetical protein
MRIPAILAASAVLVTATAASSEPTPQQKAAIERFKAQCPQTTSHLAHKTGIYRGERLAPRKLTELPPAVTYMAVYRHIGGCEAPLTMVEYRNPNRR